MGAGSKQIVLSTLLILLIHLSIHSYSQDISNLYYTNDNFPISELFFLDNRLKIGITPQIGDKPFNLYLIDEHNLILDTLSEQIYLEQILFTSDKEILISGFRSFYNVSIKQDKFEIIGDGRSFFAGRRHSSLSNVICLNDFVFGSITRRSKKNYTKDQIIAVSRELQKKRHPDSKVLLIGSQRNRRNNKYIRQVDLIYAVNLPFLFLFLGEAQTLYKIDTRSLSIDSYVFPNIANGNWAYFFDHLSSNHYALRYNESVNVLYEMKPLEGLRLVSDSIQFPFRIVGGNLHIIEDTENTLKHHLVPIKNKNNSISPLLLEQVEIRSDSLE